MAFFTTAPECAIRASHIQAPSALRQVGGNVGMLHPAAGPPRPGATPFFLGMEKTHRNLRGKPWETMGKHGKNHGKSHGKNHGMLMFFLGTIVVYLGYFEENTGWRLWILYPFLLDILGDLPFN